MRKKREAARHCRKRLRHYFENDSSMNEKSYNTESEFSESNCDIESSENDDRYSDDTSIKNEFSTSDDSRKCISTYSTNTNKTKLDGISSAAIILRNKNYNWKSSTSLIQSYFVRHRNNFIRLFQSAYWADKILSALIDDSLRSVLSQALWPASDIFESYKEYDEVVSKMSRISVVITDEDRSNHHILPGLSSVPAPNIVAEQHGVFINAGSFISKMCWAPMDPHSHKDQYLAVAVHRSLTVVFDSLDSQTMGGHMLQIYRCGALTMGTSSMKPPDLEFLIIHDWGTITDMSWSPQPLPTSTPSVPLIGHLAIACEDGFVRILPIVKRAQDREIVRVMSHCPLLCLRPVKIRSSASVFPTCLDWCKHRPDRVVVGYNSGHVALYVFEADQLCDTSTIDKEKVIIQPATFHQVFNDAIRSVKISPNNWRLVVTSSFTSMHAVLVDLTQSPRRFNAMNMDSQGIIGAKLLWPEPGDFVSLIGGWNPLGTGGLIFTMAHRPPKMSRRLCMPDISTAAFVAPLNVMPIGTISGHLRVLHLNSAKMRKFIYARFEGSKVPYQSELKTKLYHRYMLIPTPGHDTPTSRGQDPVVPICDCPPLLHCIHRLLLQFSVAVSKEEDKERLNWQLQSMVNISGIAVNPNPGCCTWLAVSLQCGLIHLVPLTHFYNSKIDKMTNGTTNDRLHELAKTLFDEELLLMPVFSNTKFGRPRKYPVGFNYKELYKTLRPKCRIVKRKKKLKPSYRKVHSGAIPRKPDSSLRQRIRCMLRRESSVKRPSVLEKAASTSQSTIKTRSEMCIRNNTSEIISSSQNSPRNLCSSSVNDENEFTLTRNIITRKRHCVLSAGEMSPKKHHKSEDSTDVIMERITRRSINTKELFGEKNQMSKNEDSKNNDGSIKVRFKCPQRVLKVSLLAEPDEHSQVVLNKQPLQKKRCSERTRKELARKVSNNDTENRLKENQINESQNTDSFSRVISRHTEIVCKKKNLAKLIVERRTRRTFTNKDDDIGDGSLKKVTEIAREKDCSYSVDRKSQNRSKIDDSEGKEDKVCRIKMGDKPSLKVRTTTRSSVINATCGDTSKDLGERSEKVSFFKKNDSIIVEEQCMNAPSQRSTRSSSNHQYAASRELHLDVPSPIKKGGERIDDLTKDNLKVYNRIEESENEKAPRIMSEDKNSHKINNSSSFKIIPLQRTTRRTAVLQHEPVHDADLDALFREQNLMEENEQKNISISNPSKESKHDNSENINRSLRAQLIYKRNSSRSIVLQRRTRSTSLLQQEPIHSALLEEDEAKNISLTNPSEEPKIDDNKMKYLSLSARYTSTQEILKMNSSINIVLQRRTRSTPLLEQEMVPETHVSFSEQVLMEDDEKKDINIFNEPEKSKTNTKQKKSLSLRISDDISTHNINQKNSCKDIVLRRWTRKTFLMEDDEELKDDKNHKKNCFARVDYGSTKNRITRNSRSPQTTFVREAHVSALFKDHFEESLSEHNQKKTDEIEKILRSKCSSRAGDVSDEGVQKISSSVDITLHGTRSRSPALQNELVPKKAAGASYEEEDDTNVNCPSPASRSSTKVRSSSGPLVHPKTVPQENNEAIREPAHKSRTNDDIFMKKIPEKECFKKFFEDPHSIVTKIVGSGKKFTFVNVSRGEDHQRKDVSTMSVDRDADSEDKRSALSSQDVQLYQMKKAISKTHQNNCSKTKRSSNIVTNSEVPCKKVKKTSIIVGVVGTQKHTRDYGNILPQPRDASPTKSASLMPKVYRRSPKKLQTLVTRPEETNQTKVDVNWSAPLGEASSRIVLNSDIDSDLEFIRLYPPNRPQIYSAQPYPAEKVMGSHILPETQKGVTRTGTIIHKKSVPTVKSSNNVLTSHLERENQEKSKETKRKKMNGQSSVSNKNNINEERVKHLRDIFGEKRRELLSQQLERKSMTNASWWDAASVQLSENSNVDVDKSISDPTSADLETRKNIQNILSKGVLKNLKPTVESPQLLQPFHSLKPNRSPV